MADTRLTFEATIAGIKVRAAKQDGYGASAKGALELALVVEQPSQPHRPYIPHRWAAPTGADEWQPRPELPAQRKGESDEKHAERLAHSEREQQDYDERREEWEARTRAYNAEMASYRPRLHGYMGVLGIAAVFGNAPFRVELTPANTELLPGFAVDMLAPPADPAYEGEMIGGVA